MSQSPTPTTKQDTVRQELDFSQAVRRIADGQKVTRIEWQNEQIFGYTKDGLLMLHKDDGLDYKWIISTGDILAIDWIVLPE